MPPVAALEDVRVVFATRAVLDGVTLGIERGQRIGVVGRNGDGKSTLLRVLAGLHEPDSGRVLRGADTRVVMLGQSDALPGRTVRDATVGHRPAHEWAADARVRAVLTGLLGGVQAEGYAEGLDTLLDGLSGGERRRVALAAALVDPGDVLLLDEPTNHLDLEAVTWLAGFLTGPAAPPALAVVTHDRWFLDAVATQTWEVAGGQVFRHEGGYAAWVLARAERERREAVAEERRRNLVRKELAWLRRGPPARTSKPQFRIDAANALIADVPEPRDTVALRRLATARLGRRVVDVHDATVAVGEPPRVLLGRLEFQLGPGDRIGLLGPNGVGKTSLVRVLLGQLAPVDGEVVLGQTVVPALLPQRIEPEDPQDRVLPSIQRVRREVEVGGRTVTAGQLLEEFGFRGERAMTRLGDLSGGELRRLHLLRLLMGGPNLLVLDEPTNDLDVETLTVIEDVLDTWPGTLVVISHDRYFLERTCDQLYALLGDGRLRHLPRGVEEYLALRAAHGSTPARSGPAPRAAADPTVPGAGPTAAASTASGGAAWGAGAGPTASGGAAGPTAAGGAGGPTAAGGAGGPTAAGGAGGPTASGGAASGVTRGLTGAAAHAARKEVARIEARLARIDAEQEGLHATMAEAHTDHERLLELSERDAALVDERGALEERWLELAEALEG
ncbi:MAG: ABC-F family ATP-binding cassette domain-containing protein [Candidatus Nanopelagicales bacterium]|nr:ABC-F family ATP-binding cassette domain-containing protein [Candidatus Nanopelagicales bacterium]